MAEMRHLLSSDSYIIEIDGIRCEVEPMPKPKIEILPGSRQVVNVRISLGREVKDWADRAMKQCYYFYLAGEH
jgi:hypothetical protein